MNINYDSPFNFKPIPTITPANAYWQNGTWKFNMSEIMVGTGATPSWQDVILSGNTALTLVNAKEDGLNYLKLFGGTELLPETYLDTVTLDGATVQRNLPEGHQQLDYLQGDGTAYIETDVEPTNNTGMKIVFEYGSSGSAATSGIYVSVAPRKDTFFISTNTGSIDTSLVFCAHRGATLNQNSDYSEAPVSGKTYTININYKNSGTMGIEGFTQTPVGTEDALSNKVLLFARLNYTNDNITASFDKIKYVEFTEGTEVIRKYYPDSYNNELGLYDTVTNTFLTNKNSTGSFTAGSDVTAPSPQYNLPIVCNNGAIKVNPNLYWTEYNGYQLSQVDGVTTSVNASVNVSGMVDCRTIKSFKITTTSPQGSFRIFKYKADNTFINASSTANIGDIVTVEDNVGYFRIQYNFSNSGGTGTENILIYNSAHNLGIYTVGTVEQVTDSLGNTASAEMLLAVGDYKDTQEVLTGTVSRNIGIKVLDGTEEWKLTGGTDRLAVIAGATAAWGAVAGLGGFCTHLTVLKSGETTFAGACRFATDFNIYEYRTAFGVDSIAQFKQWLAEQYANGTPVIIVYPLATTTTETVSGQFLSKSPVTQTAGAISNLGIAVTSSSHTTPTPTQPLQINCNNGVLKVSPNLFDKTKTLEDNKVWANNGIITTLSGYYGVNPIPVKGGHTYTRSGSHGSANYIKLADNTFTDFQDSSATITVPDNAVLWYFNNKASASRDTMMVVEGSSLPAEYIAYGVPYVDGTTETVEITGKNLFDSTPYKTGYYIDAYGQEQPATQAQDEYIIRQAIVEPSKSYTISFTGVDRTYTQRIHAYDKDGNWIQQLTAMIPNVGNITSSTITAPANCKYIRQGGRSQSDYQIELGSTATTYEPYYNGGTAAAENLFKVGTYQDVQSVIDGGVTRNIGIKVFDGTENWTKGSISFYIEGLISNIKGTSDYTPYCSHYTAYPASSDNPTQPDSIKLGYYLFTTGNFVQRVNIYDSRISSLTLEQFKQFLTDQYNAGTPVIVVYPLATATTETVTAQPMNIQAGTNIVEITEASMDNLPLEVSYKAGVTVTITEVENAQLSNSVEVTIQ